MEARRHGKGREREHDSLYVMVMVIHHKSPCDFISRPIGRFRDRLDKVRQENAFWNHVLEVYAG